MYVVIFASTYLIDNRKKYIDSETGKKKTLVDSQVMQKNNNSPRCFRVSLYDCEVHVGVHDFAIQYNSPYQVATISTLLAWIVYIITANAMVRWQKLFK